MFQSCKSVWIIIIPPKIKSLLRNFENLEGYFLINFESLVVEEVSYYSTENI